MRLVHSTKPKNLDVGVPVDTSIQIFFTQDMLMRSLSNDKISFFALSDQSFVEFKSSYADRVLTITPKERLREEESYHLIVHSGEKGVRTILNEQMLQSHKIEFTTRKTHKNTKPLVVHPHDETLQESFPAIIFEDVKEEHVNYFTVQVSRTNRFNQIVWERKVYRSGESYLSIVPNIENPDGRYYIRVIKVGKADDLIHSDIVQIVISEELLEIEEEIIEEEVEFEEIPYQSIIQNGDRNVSIEDNKEILLLFNERLDVNIEDAEIIYMTAFDN